MRRQTRALAGGAEQMWPQPAGTKGGGEAGAVGKYESMMTGCVPDT